MVRLSEKRVILFGVGGVGSWCAEALVRTGLRHLTIVDFDCVDVTNVNRQLMATTKTAFQPRPGRSARKPKPIPLIKVAP